METSRFQAVARSLFDEGSVAAPIFHGQDLIPSLHRGLAAGGGACASVASLEPVMWGPPESVDCSERHWSDWVLRGRPDPSRSSPIGTSPAPEPILGGRLPMKNHQPIGLRGGVLAALPACRTTSDSRRQSHAVLPFRVPWCNLAPGRPGRGGVIRGPGSSRRSLLSAD